MKLKLLKMKTFTFCLFAFLFLRKLEAQTYTAANYADQGDTVYMTRATLNTLNYDTTGVGIIWDYSTLSGNSQSRETFANPTQTGYTNIQFPYIYNVNNVNLAQTNGQTMALGSLSATDPYSYFKKTNAVLQQSASAYKLVIGGSSVTVKNTYTSPDIVYKFPVSLGDADSSNSSYTTNIPGVYYRQTQIKRVNHVVGSGTVITPYGTFGTSLKLESLVTQTDSIALNGTGYAPTTIVYKELKWLDPSKKYPVLQLRKELVGTSFVTSSIEYLDNKMYFQPVALFGYYSLCPIMGDTVQFQNLSTNSESFSWDFNDPASGSDNFSNLQNPTHIFAEPGTYDVKLITYNGVLSDTLIVPVVVNENLDDPTINISADQNAVCLGETINFTSTTTNAGTLPVYQWSINGNNVLGENAATFSSSTLQDGDTVSCQLISSSLCLSNLSDTSNTIVVSLISPSAGSESISACNSYFWTANGQTYTNSGVYTATLTNAQGCDSLATLNLTLTPSTAPQPEITAVGALTFCEGDEVTLFSDITSGITWSTGETSPSIVVSGSADIFVSYVDNACLISSDVVSVLVNPNPEVTITTFPVFCDTAEVFELNQGSPAGGSYLLNGSAASSFDPASEPIGEHELVYSYTDANACSGTATTTITVEDCSSGAGLDEASLSVMLFPNPASLSFELLGLPEAELVSMTLYDHTGRMVGIFNSNEINVATYANGSYFIKVTGKSFDSTLKLIIEK